MKYIFFALGLMLADLFAVILTKKIPGLHFEGQRWNWFGKIAEILLAAVIFILIPRLRRVSWSSWSQVLTNKQSIALMFGILICGGIFIGFMNPPEPFDLQTFLFQLFIPSISEELVYRGCLFFLFLSAFNGTRGVILSGILVTFWFSIIHGVGSHNGEIQFDAISLIVTALVGTILMLLRVISKSLMLPIAGHSIYNLCIQLVAVLQS